MAGTEEGPRRGLLGTWPKVANAAPLPGLQKALASRAAASGFPGLRGAAGIV